MLIYVINPFINYKFTSQNEISNGKDTMDISAESIS